MLAEICGKAALGLAFLKRVGVSHMDVKPANIIVGKKFVTKLIDLCNSYIDSEQDQTSFSRTGLDRD